MKTGRRSSTLKFVFYVVRYHIYVNPEQVSLFTTMLQTGHSVHLYEKSSVLTVVQLFHFLCTWVWTEICSIPVMVGFGAMVGMSWLPGCMYDPKGLSTDHKLISQIIEV